MDAVKGVGWGGDYYVHTKIGGCRGNVVLRVVRYMWVIGF